MQVLLAFVFITVLSINRGYEITQVPGIENISYVKQIEFDYNSNTYVATRSGGASGYDRLFKLDASNSIVLTADFYLIWKILINKNNDVYIFSSESQPDAGQYCVHLIKSESKEVVFLFKFYFDPTFHYPPFFIDSDDFIFFNTESGVAFLRPEQNIPMVVNNLEGWVFNEHVDVYGTLFLANTETSKDQIAGISKPEKENNVPSAQLLPTKEVVTTNNFKYWPNVPTIVFGDYVNNKTTVRTLSSGPLISQYNVNYTFYEGTSQRFFFLGRYATIPKSYHLHFITRDNKVVKIEENLQSGISRSNKIYATDKIGNFYIAYPEVQNDSQTYQVLLLKAEEVNFRRIRIPTDVDINSLTVDESDNLWVLAGELYVVLKGTEEASLVSGTALAEAAPLQLKLKNETNEIFISAEKGVFICTNN